MNFSRNIIANMNKNYSGYHVNRNYASPKETLSCGGQSGTTAMTSKVIPLAVRVTFTSAWESVYGHRISINGNTITEISCCDGKSYDITLDLEAIYGWDWLLAQTSFVFGHYDWYQMPTTVRVVRWAEKNRGGVRNPLYLRAFSCLVATLKRGGIR